MYVYSNVFYFSQYSRQKLPLKGKSNKNTIHINIVQTHKCKIGRKTGKLL